MDKVTPTQADRDAAAAWFDQAEADGLIRRGNRKDIPLTYAFARHAEQARREQIERDAAIAENYPSPMDDLPMALAMRSVAQAIRGQTAALEGQYT